MTHRDAMWHFQYDPFAHVPRERATVAARRADAAGWEVGIRSVTHLGPVTASTSAGERPF